MKKYLALFRIRFINSLQYRMAALAGLSTQFIWGFMEIGAFGAFYRVAPESFPMGMSQTASYIWLQQAFLVMFFTMWTDYDILASITEGGIAYEMVRPMDIYTRWLCQIAATRVAGASLRAVPVILVAALLPYPFGLSAPLGIAQFVSFVFSMLLAVSLTVVFTALVFVSLFYTMAPHGVRVVVGGLVPFLNGMIIPIPFFPEPFRRIIELLPFGAMQNMPLRIYSGHISGPEMLTGFALQIFWLATLLLLGKLAMSHALKRIIVQGG